MVEHVVEILGFWFLGSMILGALLVTKIQLAAMSRADIPADQRSPFCLYVDEFQNFATDSFAGILSESRKYRLCLVLAHQYIGRLVTAGGAVGVSTDQPAGRS